MALIESYLQIQANEMCEHMVIILEVVVASPLLACVVVCEGWLAGCSKSSWGPGGIFLSRMPVLPSRLLISISCSSILSF